MNVRLPSGSPGFRRLNTMAVLASQTCIHSAYRGHFGGTNERLSRPTFDFRVPIAFFFTVQSSAASMSGIPRLVAVLAAKDDHFFHTNSLRRRRPCGPEISSFGSRCRAVVKSCPGGAFAEPRKASQRAHGLAAHEARTPFGARAFPRHARERLPESGLVFPSWDGIKTWQCRRVRRYV